MVAGTSKGGKDEGSSLRLHLLLGNTAGTLGILTEHGPRAFGGAFTFCFDCKNFSIRSTHVQDTIPSNAWSLLF